MCGKTAHMHLVNDGARPRPLQGHVTLPVIRVRVRDHALHGRRYVVAFPTGCLTGIAFWDHDSASIRVEQQLGRIKPETPIRLEGPEGPESVDLTRFHPGHEYMPIMVGVVSSRIDGDDTRRTSVVHPIEKQQFDAGRTPGDGAGRSVTPQSSASNTGSSPRMPRALAMKLTIARLSCATTTTS